ncbi:hypothetical protein [uncultured Microbacterium sp.]|uniref:hypothetical protein n=1 Tax=uncultured Microbacterium sp. TaxID=191216 RepID=UPI0028D42D9B|nr:hypothetical protein [uncultured Microbacterium sp.]
MPPRQLRLLRAASASTVATTVAAASHTVAGGAAPHPLLVVAMASFLVPLAAVLLGAGASRFRVAATVLVSQALFHATFQMLGAPTGTAVVSGHQHHLDLSALGTAASTAAPDSAMIVGHLIAAVLTTAALCHGESMVRVIAMWVQARIRRANPLFRASHDAPAPPAFATPLLIDVALGSSVSRRGPPPSP